MAALHAQGEGSLKESFFRDFQREVTGKCYKTPSYTMELTVQALQVQMERLSSTAPSGSERSAAIDECLAGIDRLSHDVMDASSYIPAYDQRTYSQVLNIKIFHHSAKECRRLSRFLNSFRRFATPPTHPRSSNSNLARMLPRHQHPVLHESHRRSLVLPYLPSTHGAPMMHLYRPTCCRKFGSKRHNKIHVWLWRRIALTGKTMAQQYGGRSSRTQLKSPYRIAPIYVSTCLLPHPMRQAQERYQTSAIASSISPLQVPTRHSPRYI